MMLSDLENEDDWDTEEMQTALKIVLKYEIQSLLERLSHHGEETVLLTANRLDNCVGHLASSNAMRFVDSKDVGDLKVKFLTFLSDPNVPIGQYYDSTNVNKNTIGGTINTESEHRARKLNISKPSLDNTDRQVTKRSLEDVSMSKDKQGSHLVDPKRRKLDSSDSIPSPQAGTKQQASAKNAIVLPQGKPSPAGDIKLNTTKVVSKSGFVEERLSAADFQKFIQQYKPMSESEGNEEEEFDEEEMYDDDEDEEYNDMLEEGEIPFPYSQQAQMYQQKQSGKKQLQTVNISVSNSGNAIINVNKGVVTKPGPKSQEAVKKLGEMGSGDNVAKSVQNVRDDGSDKTKSGFAMPNAVRTKPAVGSAGKISEFKGPEAPSNKELSGDNKLTRKDSEQKDSTKQVQRPSEAVKTNQDKNDSKKMNQSASATPGKPQGSFDGNVDEMDTETLVKMVKAQHAQSQSDADKQIQEKLGKLSSRLSWVVEYPSKKQGEGTPGQSGQNINPNQNPQFSHEMIARMEGEFEDDDEDYDEEEEYDEDELNEQELEALAYMRKMRNNSAPPPPPPPAVGRHFEGEIGDEEYDEDFDQEMEEFDTQHRVYNPMEGEMKMGEFGGVGADGSPDQGYSVYQRSSPSLENYLMIGAVMAKCLVCNKIVRKAEVKQHNKLHDEEEYEEGDEECEDGGEAGYMEEGEGPHEEREGLQDKEEGFEGEEGYQEGEEVEYKEEEQEEEFDMAEFTAEPLIAEKINTQQLDSVSGKTGEQKSTVCDICNKRFKSHTNMVRHKKIHTDSRNFLCPVCPKTFRLQNYLNKHVKKMHPEYEGQQAGDGDGGAVAQDGGAEEETEQKAQT